MASKLEEIQPPWRPKSWSYAAMAVKLRGWGSRKARKPGAQPPKAALTTSRASAWTAARCSGPRKDSA